MIHALILAALSVQAAIQEGRAIQVQIEGEALVPGAVLTVRASRESLLPGAPHPQAPLPIFLPVSRAGRAEALLPLDCSAPGRYRVEVVLSSQEDPEEPAVAFVEVGLEGKGYLEALLKSEDSLEKAFEEAGGMLARMGELETLSMKDPAQALSQWTAWREGARKGLEAAAREASQSPDFFPSARGFLKEFVGGCLLPQEQREFEALKAGKPIPIGGPFKPSSRLTPAEKVVRVSGMAPGFAHATSKDLDEFYRRDFLRESLLQRLSALKALLKAAEARTTPRIQEALDLWGAGLPVSGEAEKLGAKDAQLPVRPPLYPNRLGALHASARAWMEAEETQSPQAAALKKDLSLKFQALWDSARP